jgi:hypothetical protein
MFKKDEEDEWNEDVEDEEDELLFEDEELF